MEAEKGFFNRLARVTVPTMSRCVTVVEISLSRAPGWSSAKRMSPGKARLAAPIAIAYIDLGFSLSCHKRLSMAESC
jgi:hypothetical protein